MIHIYYILLYYIYIILYCIILYYILLYIILYYIYIIQNKENSILFTTPPFQEVVMSKFN